MNFVYEKDVLQTNSKSARGYPFTVWYFLFFMIKITLRYVESFRVNKNVHVERRKAKDIKIALFFLVAVGLLLIKVM